MKDFILKEWKSGFCLANCTLAVARYFGGLEKEEQVEDRFKHVQIDGTHFLWPSSAVRYLADTGLNVLFYENDINVVRFADVGLEAIREKYGEEGVKITKSRFDQRVIFEDTKAIVRYPLVSIKSEIIPIENIIKEANDPDKIYVLLLDFNTVYKKKDKPYWGHYFLLNGFLNNKFKVCDPRTPEEPVFIDSETIEESNRRMNWEIQSFVVGK